MGDPAVKYDALRARLKKLGSLLVAYSGGVDSTFLAFAAHAALGAKCMAALATSDTYPASEIEGAREVAAALGLTLIEVETYEMADPAFRANTTDRCYHCKTELFSMLQTVARAKGLRHVADGSNTDDLADFRPGARAAREHGVVSPLRDAGMTKKDVRALAQMLGLPNADKPSMACLASRFPYGQEITEDGLARVAAAEDELRGMGLSQFRVRAHGDVARLEVDAADQERAWVMRKDVSSALRNAGFVWAAQDLNGYRTGSMNEVLPDDSSSTL